MVTSENTTRRTFDEVRVDSRYQQVYDAVNRDIEVSRPTRRYIENHFLPSIQHLSRKAVKAKTWNTRLTATTKMSILLAQAVTGIGVTLGIDNQTLVGTAFALTTIASAATVFNDLNKYQETHERARQAVESQFRQFWSFYGLVGLYRGMSRALAENAFLGAAETAFSEENASYFKSIAEAQEAQETDQKDKEQQGTPGGNDVE